MIVRITVMVLRVSVLLALILGILFWVNSATTGLIPIHMLLGLLVALSLLILGVVIGITKGGTWVLGIGAIALSILVVMLGLQQDSLLVGDLHWVIKVLHLLLGLLAVGFGEMIGARYKRLAK